MFASAVRMRGGDHLPEGIWACLLGGVTVVGAGRVVGVGVLVCGEVRMQWRSTSIIDCEAVLERGERGACVARAVAVAAVAVVVVMLPTVGGCGCLRRRRLGSV